MTASSDSASAAPAGTCEWCGAIHAGRKCPMVRAIEYHPDGSIKRVEFHEPTPGWPRLDFERTRIGGTAQ